LNLTVMAWSGVVSGALAFRCVISASVAGSSTAEGRGGSWWITCSAARRVVAVASGSPVPGLRVPGVGAAGDLQVPALDAERRPLRQATPAAPARHLHPDRGRVPAADPQQGRLPAVSQRLVVRQHERQERVDPPAVMVTGMPRSGSMCVLGSRASALSSPSSRP
jgi:hypothetical protein